MARDDLKTLVSTSWLADHLDDPDLRILDATWFMPNEARDAKAEYETAHIPGARFFDIDDISDQRSELPHMMPPTEKFIQRMRAMGVGDGHQVVVYDSKGIFSAARVWWMFRLMGKTDVAVLDGGLPKWQAEGHPVDDLPAVIRDRHMTTNRQDQMVKDVTQVASASKLADYVIVDARAPERFRGEVAEPREGLRSGHIPNSRNVFFRDLLTAEGTMKSPEETRVIFETAGVDLTEPAILSCGSGVTAAILALAMERLGKTDHAVYDGSWSEWGTFHDLPIATGDA